MTKKEFNKIMIKINAEYTDGFHSVELSRTAKLKELYKKYADSRKTFSVLQIIRDKKDLLPIRIEKCRMAEVYEETDNGYPQMVYCGYRVSREGKKLSCNKWLEIPQNRAELVK